MSLTQRQRDSAAGHYRKVMEILGIDLKSEHSRDTPDRVIRALEEMTECLRTETKELDAKMTLFDATGDTMVCIGPMDVASLCAHHHSPFVGTCHIGYLPDKLMLGLSKFKRVVDHFSAGPTVQEQLVVDIAEYLNQILKPQALYVYMSADHTCMTARGVKAHGCKTATHAIRGKLGIDPHIKNEFLQYVRGV